MTVDLEKASRSLVRMRVTPLTAPVAEFVRIPAFSVWRAAYLPSIERKPTCYPKTSRFEPDPSRGSSRLTSRELT
jgi:hypothetical protein